MRNITIRQNNKYTFNLYNIRHNLKEINECENFHDIYRATNPIIDITIKRGNQ